MAKVKDPVCGMLIESTTAAASYELNGETYYFCSTAEKDAFVKNPHSYISERAVELEKERAGDIGLEKHEPPFTKKGGFVAPKFGSAGSGGAEYEPGP